MKKSAVVSLLSFVIGASNLYAIKPEQIKLYDEIENQVKSVLRLNKEEKKEAIKEKVLPALMKMEEACKNANDRFTDSKLAGKLWSCAEYMAGAYGLLGELNKEKEWSVTALTRKWYWYQNHTSHMQPRALLP